LEQDPQVALHLYAALAHADLAQPGELLGNFRGHEQLVTGAELGDPLPRAKKFLCPLLEFTIDLDDCRGKRSGAAPSSSLIRVSGTPASASFLILTTWIACSAV